MERVAGYMALDDRCWPQDRGGARTGFGMAFKRLVVSTFLG